MILPYHCPTFRTDHLTEPCQKNLARVKALKEAKKHVGPIEKCVECRGKMLITKPRTVIEGLPAPENWVEKRFVEPERATPKEYTSPEQKGWESHPEVTTAPLYLKDVGAKEPEMRQLSPEKIAKTRVAVQRMAERYKKPPQKEKILSEEAKKTIIIPEGERWELSIPPRAESTVLEAPVEVRYCPAHPEVPQRIDRLGRFMGLCAECLSIRGKKCGVKNFERGVTAPPMSIPLNLPKYAEIKNWLVTKADDEDRTLQMQIMYILKQAKKNAGAWAWTPRADQEE